MASDDPRRSPLGDTDIGGPAAGFPVTAWSAVRGAKSDDPEERTRSFEALVAAYWKPVYKTIRIKWRRSNEDAKDLTQGFFARAMEKDFFASYDPSRARFRTFLRTCLDGWVKNEHKAQSRLKRGGGTIVLSLDFAMADGELRFETPRSPDDLERTFDREWARSLFGLAVEALRVECLARGKEVHYRLFEAYDLDAEDGSRPTYQELAERHGIKITDVTNHLAFARRALRRIVLDKLREITATEEEFHEEARSLFGADAT